MSESFCILIKVVLICCPKGLNVLVSSSKLLFLVGELYPLGLDLGLTMLKLWVVMLGSYASRGGSAFRRLSLKLKLVIGGSTLFIV